MGHEVVVLIDCGATHNFISEDLAAKLGLSMADMSRYGVIIGTWLSVKGDGMCKGVAVQM